MSIPDSTLRISTCFNLEDATRSVVASRLGIDNKPNDIQLQNIKMAARMLDEMVSILKTPILIHSWFRVPALNHALHGAINSAHMDGLAIDFSCWKYGNPYIVANRIRHSSLKYDKLIYEYAEWVHISFDPRSRKENLTICFPQKIYAEGILLKEDYIKKVGKV